MRKIIIGAALSATALTLAACSGPTERGADTSDQERVGTGTETESTSPDTATTVAVLDANTATIDQLAGAEGVTDELAEAIVAGQPYASATAFNAMLTETLSEEQAAAVRTRVFVPVNLNSATREDIELIPGMTPRMVHEFEEYRPYADMAEFNREIGKYVDAEEVARFRRYVTL